MPRRTKTYIGPNRILLNGGRAAVSDAEGQPISGTTLDAVPVDIGRLRNQVETYIQNFDELAQLEDRDQFIKDLAHECASAMTMRLDHLTQGTRTKPDEWTTQILVRGVASVLERHKLKAAISEYERGGEIRQSLYLRLVPGLIKIAGHNAPKNVKGLCLRARRIKLDEFNVPKEWERLHAQRAAQGLELSVSTAALDEPQDVDQSTPNPCSE
jgi:hypothetical protein